MKKTKKYMGLMTAVLAVLFFSAQSHASLVVLPDGVIDPISYVLPSPPTKWGDPTLGTSASVTWSLVGDGTACASWHCSGTISSPASFMPAGYKNEIQRAFDAWESVAGINFVEVSDSGDDFAAPGAQGNIRIGGHYIDGVDPTGNTLAHAFLPPDHSSSSAGGDIHFDSGDTWTIGGGSGIDIFSVALHEIGHAIGLDHSADQDAVMYKFYSSPYSGLDEDDINGAVALYGAPAPVPLPAAAWLMLSGLGALFGFAGRRRISNPVSVPA